MKKYIAAIGGINLDIKAKSKANFIPNDSNPGEINFASGGVVRNIAHNLALLDVPVKLISVVGNDWEGERILKETADAGVDITNTEVLNHKKTGTYVAILNSTGEMEAAVSSMDIFAFITPQFLENKIEVIKNAAFIVCDANISKESIEYLINISAKYQIPICIEPVSAAKAQAIKEVINTATLITPNIHELKILSGTGTDSSDAALMASRLIDKGIQYVITTLGEKGICLVCKNSTLCIDSYKTEVKDVTGAGDSLTAGLIYGLLMSDSIEYACKCGLAAASITVADNATVSHNMCRQKIQDIINSSR